ncbi:hypothetical protein [Paenibacillus sp. SN-8-1]|uniref:hypothetical protein n=1 Tax=Paenibacillus sp. SN-8-1 TaxID=3435409 RepID=UPI003D9A7098
MSEKIIICKQCAHSIDEHYLINYRGDYFCGENCHETYHEANAHEFNESDDGHPYYFDYSSIRQEFIHWSQNWTKFLQEELKYSNEYAQWTADDLVDSLDEIIWSYEQYIFTEGGDGVFAREIYQYTLKLREIQDHILKWRPHRETYYGMQCCFNYDDTISDELISSYLNDIMEKEGSELEDDRYQRPHPFHEYFDWVFNFEGDRDFWFEVLSPYFHSSPLELDTYTAHLCDGGCNDYLDISDTDYWHDGWFYCHSCISNKEVGELDRENLVDNIKFYNQHMDIIQKLENPEGFRSLIRRACRIHRIEMPEWAQYE